VRGLGRFLHSRYHGISHHPLQATTCMTHRHLQRTVL
jgi:hypothetical protein